MISFNYRSVQTVVDRFQGNFGTTDGGELMSKHSNQIVGYVAAKSHLNHIHRNVKPLYVDQASKVVQTTNSCGFPLSTLQGEESYSLGNHKWQGPLFKFDVSDQNTPVVKVRESEKFYEQVGQEGSVDSTKQILEEETKELEHRISDAFSEVFSYALSIDEGGLNTENIVQTGDESSSGIELKADELADLDKTTETTVYGLGEMVANAYNTSLLERLQQSPHFDKAAQLLHVDLAEELSRYGSTKSSGQTTSQNRFGGFPGVFYDTQNQQLAVYVEEPTVLNRLSKYVKMLDVAEDLSMPGYKVAFIGEKTIIDKNGKEKSLDHFSTFGQSGVYNKQRANRQKISNK